MPILWALGALVSTVVLLLFVLTLTHLNPTDTTVVPSPATPTQPTTPPKSCYPFEC